MINHLTVLNSIIKKSLQPSYENFIRNIRNFQLIQNNKLMDYIRNNRNTQFGREHNFGRINGISDYRKNIPVSGYSRFEPYIKKIMLGERNVLCSDNIKLLEPTGGSTGGSKLIPYNNMLKKEFRNAVNPWIFDLYNSHKDLINGRSYWSITPDASSFQQAESRVKISFDSDSSYFGLTGKILEKTFAVPHSIKAIKNMDNFRFLTSLFLLNAPDLKLISVWNPTYLLLQLDHILKNQESLVKAVYDGDTGGQITENAEAVKPLIKKNKERARELIKIFSKNDGMVFEKIWPGLKLISLWADGPSKIYFERVKTFFTKVILQPKGLIATECIVSAPIIKAGGAVISYSSHFFEFINDRGIYLLNELETGSEYRVVVTTAGGLYRYDTGDYITVTGKFNGLPVVKFNGRINVSDYFGEKLEELHVSDVVEAALKNSGIKAGFLLFACETEINCGKYVLFIKSGGLNREKSREIILSIDKGLCANFHYKYARELGQLSLPGVFLLRGDPEKIFMERMLEEGRKLGAVKSAVLDKRSGWSRYFEGQFVN